MSAQNKQRPLSQPCVIVAGMCLQKLILVGTLATWLLASHVAPQAQEAVMTHHAHGTFEVKVQPFTPAPAEGLLRMSIEKTIHGDLEATSKGEMLSGGDLKSGSAGYVAMETITGKLAGKRGSFALQHLATMDPAGQKMDIQVVPGSGTGELKGLAGTFTITIADGKHSYQFDYTFPANQ